MSMIEVVMFNNGYLFYVSYMGDYYIIVEFIFSLEIFKYFLNCLKLVLGDMLVMCLFCLVENIYFDIRILEVKILVVIIVFFGLFFVSYVVMYNLIIYKGVWI